MSVGLQPTAGGPLQAVAVTAEGDLILITGPAPGRETPQAARWRGAQRLWAAALPGRRVSGIFIRGERLVIGCCGVTEDTLVTLALDGGAEISALAVETCGLQGLAVSEDGARAITSALGDEVSTTPQILDLTTGQTVLKGRRRRLRVPVEAVAISETGARVITAAGGEIRAQSMLDPRRGARTLPGDLPLACVGDQAILAWRRADRSTWRPTLALWHLKSKVPRWIQHGPWPEGDPAGARFVDGGRAVALCFATHVVILSADRGQILRRLSLPESTAPGHGPWRIEADAAGRHLCLWRAMGDGGEQMTLDAPRLLGG